MKTQRLPFLHDQKGLSLIELLIAIGVFSFVTMVMATMISNMQKESRALSEKLASLEVEKTMQANFNDDVCRYMLTDPGVSHALPNPQVFDTSSLPTVRIELTRIPMSQDASAPSIVAVGQPASIGSPTVEVSRIELRDFSSAGIADVYYANLYIEYDSAKLVRPLKPTRKQLTVHAEAVAGSPNSVEIRGCGSVGTGAGYIATQSCVGQCTYTNTTSKAVYINGTGGDSNSCNGGTQNSYDLSGRVDGVVVAHSTNTSPSGFKMATIGFFLPPGSTMTMSSSPWYCGYSASPAGHFTYTVYAF